MLLDLVQYIQPWICGNCNWQLVLQPVRFRFFTGPSTFVPSLHRLRACSFQLFTPLASFSYATWSSATFLASYSEPWTWWTFNKLIASITNITACTIWVFTGPSTIVPSLHRLRACIFRLFTPLASFSYAAWSSAIHSALNLWKLQLAISFTACTISVFHRAVHVCTFVAPTESLFFSTLYTSSFIFICYLI